MKISDIIESMKNMQDEITDITNEAILEEPKFDFKNMTDSERKKWITYRTAMYDVVSKLTKMTGYWYVGSESDKIRDKIEKMTPEQYGKIRNQVAGLLKRKNDLDKLGKEIAKEANDLISNIEKMK